jgi:HSP20 family protein
LEHGSSFFLKGLIGGRSQAIGSAVFFKQVKIMDDFDRKILDEFKELERQMGRMLRSTSLTRVIPMSSKGWQPAVDVYETTDSIIVFMDTAGIDMENFAITAEKNRITVEGCRSLPKRGNVCCIHQLEIEMGYFKRTISFPVAVNHIEPSFSCQNGILEIRLPKITKSCSVP